VPPLSPSTEFKFERVARLNWSSDIARNRVTARSVVESLTPRPGIREQHRPIAAVQPAGTCSHRLSREAISAGLAYVRAVMEARISAFEIRTQAKRGRFGYARFPASRAPGVVGRAPLSWSRPRVGLSSSVLFSYSFTAGSVEIANVSSLFSLHQPNQASDNLIST